MNVIVWRHAGRGLRERPGGRRVRLRARRHPVIGRRRAASLPARIGGGCAGCDACGCEHGPRAARRGCRQR